MPTIVETLRRHGIAVVRYPIHDTDVPVDPITFDAVLDGVREELSAGRSIVVACRGGLGRTGTVVACLLRNGGLDANAAIALTRSSRPNTIENARQEAFVRAWT